MKLNKGAMFGLDARIALAIFGALSVISGASLYSAIQDSKVTVLLSEFREIEKSIEQYILDTGQDILVTTSVGHEHYMRDIDELFSSSVTGWKGPYLPDKTDSSDPDDYYRSWPNGAASSNLMIRYSEGDYTICDGDAKCFYIIELNAVPEAIGKALDLKVDGTDDRTTGKIRYNYHTNPAFVGIYYTSIPMLAN